MLSPSIVPVMPFGLIKYSSPLTKVAVKVPLPDSSNSVQLKVVAQPRRGGCEETHRHKGHEAQQFGFHGIPPTRSLGRRYSNGKANIGEADKHQDCAHKSVKKVDLTYDIRVNRLSP